MPNAGRAFQRQVKEAGGNIEDVNQRFQDRMKDRVEAFRAQMAGVSDTLRAVHTDPAPDLDAIFQTLAPQVLRPEPETKAEPETKPEPKRKRKAKRSRKGQRLVWDVRESIFMDALREHHDYEGGEAENFDPMPFCDLANALAQKTGRSAKKLYPYVTEFLKVHFKTGAKGPYPSYETACAGKEPLRRVLAKYYGDTKAFGVSRDG